MHSCNLFKILLSYMNETGISTVPGGIPPPVTVEMYVSFYGIPSLYQLLNYTLQAILKDYLLFKYIYIYIVIFIIIISILFWWTPVIPSRNLDTVFTYKHI